MSVPGLHWKGRCEVCHADIYIYLPAERICLTCFEKARDDIETLLNSLPSSATALVVGAALYRVSASSQRFSDTPVTLGAVVDAYNDAVEAAWRDTQ